LCIVGIIFTSNGYFQFALEVEQLSSPEGLGEPWGYEQVRDVLLRVPVEEQRNGDVRLL
jgi:hypothetical protein